MTNLSLTKRFPIWSVLALLLVTGGGMLARTGVAQRAPAFVTGKDVPPAYESKNIGQTIKQLWQIYDIMKNDNWSTAKVPFSLMTYPDQKLHERADHRASNMGAVSFPRLELYNDIAFYVDTYFRENLVIYSDHVVSHPDGFYLVMFRTGELVKVKPEDVRMYPHPTVPDGQVPVFPGMKVYNPKLPKLPNYE